MSIGDKSVYADPRADTSEHSDHVVHSVAYIVYIVRIPRVHRQYTDIYQLYLGQLIITETSTNRKQLQLVVLI